MELLALSSTGWFFGSFVSATLDAIFKVDELYERSPMLGRIAAMGQIFLAQVIIAQVLQFVSPRRDAYPILGYFTAFWALETFSPRAIQTLQDSYYNIHVFLYGESAKTDSCCEECANEEETKKMQLLGPKTKNFI
jgi:hypothetical protein